MAPFPHLSLLTMLIVTISLARGGTQLPRDAPVSCPCRCISTYLPPQISETLDGHFKVLLFQDRPNLIRLMEYCCKTLFSTGVYCQIDWKFLAGMFNYHLIKTDLR